MKQTTQRIDDVVETICNKGCRMVRDDLAAMGRGKSLPELNHLSPTERDFVHKELAAIMSVYGDACRIPEDTQNNTRWKEGKMALFDEILGQQGGALVGQLAKQFGIPEEQATGAVKNMLPSLQRGLQSNSQSEAGLGSLLDAIHGGKHSQYVDEPEVLANQSTQKDGNDILGHIFGNNKDVSRNTAGYAAEKTGLDSALLKKMLPIVAAVVMGMLAKKSSSGSSRSSTTTSRSDSPLGGLGSLLDADNDGSIADDLIKMATKFF